MTATRAFSPLIPGVRYSPDRVLQLYPVTLLDKQRDLDLDPGSSVTGLLADRSWCAALTQAGRSDQPTAAGARRRSDGPIEVRLM